MLSGPLDHSQFGQTSSRHLAFDIAVREAAMAVDHAPSIRLTNATAEFMDNHLDAHFHPSLPNPDVGYDPAVGNFRLLRDTLLDTIFCEALQERKAFLEAIKAFEDEDRRRRRIELGIFEEAGWDDVLEIVSNAQNDAEVNAIKGMSGAVRNLARRLGDAGPAFNAWLQILPNDTFGSAICGGFKIIIDAATKHKDLCQEVFDALGEIPEVIKDADFSFKEYKSEELFKRVAKLYTVIMETLKRILSFYQKRASGRHIGAARNVFKAIVKGPNYGRTIEADIQRVKESASAVKQEADRCFHRRIKEMKNAQEFQTLQTTRVVNIMQGMFAHLQGIHEHVQYREIQYRRESKADNLALRNEMTELKRATTPQRSPRNGPTLRKIGQLLNTSPSAADQDMEEVLREAQRFPVFLQTQVKQFITSQKLQDWLVSPYSRALLAQASVGDEKISALSFVASLLVQSFGTSEDAIPLYFYCGLHTDPYDDSL
ncbi:MAG: hypothetical protein LQ349_004975, partial [Xanthoria aureola]